MSEWSIEEVELSALSELVYQVSRGVKPMASRTIHKTAIPGARAIVEQHGLSSRVTELNETFVNVDVALFDEILFAATIVETLDPPHRDVLNGLLYGYSPAAIRGFLEENWEVMV